MPARDVAPVGAPCWTDLWTSDVDGSRRFYSELFGWEALESSPDLGGYFMFARDGVPVAGGMGDMGDVVANNAWKVYLATDDIARTVEEAAARGAEIFAPAIPVADLGVQAVLADPTGAALGAWQADTFPGFTVLDEPGSPSWFELYTRDYTSAVEFYRDVFKLDTEIIGDSDEFRYTTLRSTGGSDQLAGIMDASAFLPEGVPAHWIVYWEVSNVDATVATATKLGGSVIMEGTDTPYGRMATLADTTGAQFKIRGDQ